LSVLISASDNFDGFSPRPGTSRDTIPEIFGLATPPPPRMSEELTVVL
jgi:hypothetical protein